MLRPGIYPFWFWNGDLSEDEIEWQIREMAAQGIRGFFIHSRQGLKQPYLSDAFFRMVESAVSVAEETGLIVHLYDEYPYPSGVAGGEVTLGNPHFHATRLVQRTFDSSGGHVRLDLPRGKVLNCTAYSLENGQVVWESGADLLPHVGMVLTAESYNEVGLTQYNRKRYFASQPTPVLDVALPKKPLRIFVSVQTVVEHHKYWWHFVDVLNPDAVRAFLDLTHERYFQRLGSKFGKSISSIFVDETEPFWSERVPATFQAECGYDLLPLLPALQDDAHPQHLQVKADLFYLMHQMFCRTFEEQISQWCAAHNILYSGEKPSFRLSQLRYMDIPGCEPGHTKAGAPMDILRARLRQNARGTASAAYFYGKEGSLCECFHSLGWSATLQDAKVISEGLLLAGIDYLVPHGFFYTTHALAKHDAPPTFFFQMPYWSHFGQLSERLDTIAAHFQGSFIDAKVLLVDPGSGLPTHADLGAYERLMQALMAAQIDFLIVDTDILEGAKVTAGQARIRDIAADWVILPPVQMVEEPLARQMQVLSEAGVGVLCLSPSLDADRVVNRILARTERPLVLEAITGDASRIYVVTRTVRSDGTQKLWFLLNTGSDEIRISLDSASDLEETPLDPSLPPMLVWNGESYERTINPFESVLLATADAPPITDPPPVIRVPVNNPVQFTLKHKNLLRLYRWQMALLDGQGRPYAEHVVPAIPLANQLLHGGFRFAPAVDTFFGSTPELRLPELRAQYRADFSCAYPGTVELVMEPGSIVGDWNVQVNDSESFGLSAFRATDAHVRGSLGIDITRFMRQGQNSVTVCVRTDRLDGGLRNPLYLAGDFGVELTPVRPAERRPGGDFVAYEADDPSLSANVIEPEATFDAVALNPARLVERSPVGEFEAYETNGLPFFAGIIEYETTFELAEIATDEMALVQVEHGLPFQEATEVALNDGPWRPLLWSPYRAWIPTRELCPGRNTLRVRVYSTLIRSFEGQTFDIPAHVYRDIG
jgi:hypothetical protein